MDSQNDLTFHLFREQDGNLRLTDVTRSPVHQATRILIIGGGVTGLTTAWTLLDAGYSVAVVAEKWAPATPRITSQIAGALWEWPPAVCGKHTDIISLTNSKRWCLGAYHIFDKIATIDPEGSHGVRMRMANFFFDKPIERMSEQLSKMQEIQAAGIRGFHHDSQIIARHAVNQEAGVVDSYQHLAPVIDTDAYMIWLQALVERKGAVLHTERIHGDLLQSEDDLLTSYHADAIVNATGLSGWELANDKTVYPLRGALIRVVNDGSKFPRVMEALCVTHDDTRGEDEDIVFIVPRNDNLLILGGLAQPNVWSLDLTLASPEIERMRKRCNKFVPGLEHAELDVEAPLVQGLRPFRRANVRVERELRPKRDGSVSRIVHSYGQGGAGFSLSFGCAGDVLGLIQQALQRRAPERMTMDVRAML